MDELLDGISDIAEIVFGENEPRKLRPSGVAWWKKEAEAAAAKIIPLRMERYWEHLLRKLEEEQASPAMRASVPVAVRFAWSLLTGKPSQRVKLWKSLVAVAGVERAEKLVVELLVQTDMFAHSQLGPAICSWAETAYSSKVYPPCMERG